MSLWNEKRETIYMCAWRSERAAEKMFSGSMKTKIHSCLFLIYTECVFSPRFIHSQTSATRFEGKFHRFMSFLCINMLQFGLAIRFPAKRKGKCWRCFSFIPIKAPYLWLWNQSQAPTPARLTLCKCADDSTGRKDEKTVESIQKLCWIRQLLAMFPWVRMCFAAADEYSKFVL